MATNEIDEIAQESKRYANAQTPRPAAPAGRAVDLTRPFEQISSAPSTNPNVQGGLLSKEAAAYQATRGAGAAAAGTGAAPAAAAAAPSPIADAAKNAGQRFIQGATSSLASQLPNLPGAGAIGRLASSVAGSTTGLAGKIAPFVAPVVEAGRVAQVAADPAATKGDVVQQAAEGTGRWGATAAGAAVGAGLGNMTGPAARVLAPLGAIAGGAAGYLGGDAVISKLRSAFGLGDRSPAEQTAARDADARAAAAEYQQGQQARAQQPARAASPITQLAQQAAPAAQPATPATPVVRQAAAPAAGRGRAAPADSKGGSGRYDMGSYADNEVPVTEYMKGSTVSYQANSPLGQYILARGGSIDPYLNEKEFNQFVKDNQKDYSRFMDARLENTLNEANPTEAKTKGKIAEIAAENAGRRDVAGIQAASSRYNTDANISARRDELKNNVVYSEEAVDDGMGGTKVVRKAFRPDGTPITGEKKPSLEVATQQAQNAIKAGASKEAVNGILQGYGYPAVK